MCLNPSLLVNLKHVIRNHISVGVKHMLKSCSILNGCFLELEPTLLFLFFFGTIHLCSSTHLYCESLGSTHPAGKRVALWLLREKPDRSITRLTSRTLHAEAKAFGWERAVMWRAVERANSLFAVVAPDSETNHRGQKEPAQTTRRIARPCTEACLFEPSLRSCGQWLELTPGFLTLGGSTWTLPLAPCSAARTGSP